MKHTPRFNPNKRRQVLFLLRRHRGQETAHRGRRRDLHLRRGADGRDCSPHRVFREQP